MANTFGKHLLLLGFALLALLEITEDGPFVMVLLVFVIASAALLVFEAADSSDLLLLTTSGPLVFALGVAIGTRGFGLKSEGSNLSENIGVQKMREVPEVFVLIL